MRRVLNRLGELAVLCQSHDKHVPHMISTQSCETCSSKLCYVCATHHSVSLSHSTKNQLTSRLSPAPSYSEKAEKNLRLFNAGVLAELNVNDLKCQCGIEVSKGSQPGFCVACGNAHCSDLCHSLLSDSLQCVFHLNFSSEAPYYLLRSLRFENIKYAEANRLAVGSPLQKTSRSFLFGMKHNQEGMIYLQKGWLSFGHIQPQLAETINPLPHALLDLHLLKRRSCLCECPKCLYKGEHPVISCNSDCDKSFSHISVDVVHRDDVKENCECPCEFCQSSVTVPIHKKLDCLEHCFERDHILNE